MATEEPQSEDESTTESVFNSVSDTNATPMDIYQEFVEAWLLTPLMILWNDYRGRAGIIIVTIYLLAGTLGTMIVEVPYPNQGPRLLQPFESMQYPLGTDGMGQDLLGLMIHSTPAMFKMMFAGAVVANGFAVVIGMIAGYKGGTIDRVLMTVADTLMAIPGLPLLLILAAIFEPRNPYVVGIVLNITGWAGMSRALRSQVLPLRNESYIESSRAQGQSQSNILVKDVFPNLAPYVMINFIGGATGIITAAVGLYFLGVLPFTNLNWGVVLNQAYAESGAMYSLRAAHWLIVPLVTITGLTFGLTLLAQATDKIFNPRIRARYLDGEEELDEDVDEDDMASTATMRT